MGQWSWGASSYLGRGWGALGRDPAPSELRRTLRRSSDNLPGWFLGRVARRAFAYVFLIYICQVYLSLQSVFI